MVDLETVKRRARRYWVQVSGFRFQVLNPPSSQKLMGCTQRREK
jgi:hypothetical protein